MDAPDAKILFDPHLQPLGMEGLMDRALFPEMHPRYPGHTKLPVVTHRGGAC